MIEYRYQFWVKISEMYLYNGIWIKSTENFLFVIFHPFCLFSSFCFSTVPTTTYGINHGIIYDDGSENAECQEPCATQRCHRVYCQSIQWLHNCCTCRQGRLIYTGEIWRCFGIMLNIELFVDLLCKMTLHQRPISQK